MSGRAIVRPLLGFLATVLIAGFLTSVLVRITPGFEFDERVLDPRLSAESVRAIQNSRAEHGNVLLDYLHYLWRICRGDFGFSRSLGQPIASLLAERAATTAGLIGIGLAGAWAGALLLAVPAVMYRLRLYETFAGLFSSVLLCVPSAGLAVLLFLAGGPAKLGMALLLVPQIFQYARNILRQAYGQPHVLSAHARGIKTGRVFLRHVLPHSLPQLLALAGVSVSMALGAAIPLEVISDLPGIGQLAWKAALARDLPLLITLTLLITIVTQLANSLSDVAIAAVSRGRS